MEIRKTFDEMIEQYLNEDFEEYKDLFENLEYCGITITKRDIEELDFAMSELALYIPNSNEKDYFRAIFHSYLIGRKRYV